MIFSVIGSNYGDEGKGLAVDLLAAKSNKPLVIRHNGGAQAGHTVDIDESTRFVFHEISSGSFRGADTYWAKTFLPDLFKLGEEADEFRKISGIDVNVFASSKTRITLIFDVLLNMFSETLRGDGRHGSCGMGIWEAFLRNKAGYEISIGWLKSLNSIDDFVDRLIEIRKEYVIPRIIDITDEIGNDITPETAEILEMISSNEVLTNFADTVWNNLKMVISKEMTSEFLSKYDDVIFEGAQGLCLDEEYKASLPHVTASKTGLNNPVMLLKEIGLSLDEVIYVTRSYLTKHGAGPLCEDERLTNLLKNLDKTNIPNPWQGEIRYACFENLNWLIGNIKADYSILPADWKTGRSLLVTHLNETTDEICFRDGQMRLDKFSKVLIDSEVFEKIYLSRSKFSSEIAL